MIRSLCVLTTVVAAVASSGMHVEKTQLWNTRPHHNKAKSRGFAYEKEISNEMFDLVPENIMTLEEKRRESTKTAAAEDTGIYEIVSVTPTAIDNNDIITVSFFATQPNSQAYGDWIGAYSPPDVDITKTVPVKYGWCDESSEYNTNGVGQLSFNMTNLRSDIKFYYFTSGTYYPVNVNSSDTTVSFNNINEPLRPRVVPTGTCHPAHPV